MFFLFSLLPEKFIKFYFLYLIGGLMSRMPRRRLTPAGRRNLKKRQGIIAKNVALLRKSSQPSPKPAVSMPVKKKKPINDNRYSLSALRSLGIPEERIENLGNQDYTRMMIDLGNEIEANKRKKKKKK